MLQSQYSEIQNARLIDLNEVPLDLLMEYLATKPSQMQESLIKLLNLH